jgi:hypothetical protein
MLHVTAGAGSLAMTLDALNLVTANSVDLNDDWYIEVETGAEGRISTNPITSIPTLITLSASTVTNHRLSESRVKAATAAALCAASKPRTP